MARNGVLICLRTSALGHFPTAHGELIPFEKPFQSRTDLPVDPLRIVAVRAALAVEQGRPSLHGRGLFLRPDGNRIHPAHGEVVPG